MGAGASAGLAAAEDFCCFREGLPGDCEELPGDCKEKLIVGLDTGLNGNRKAMNFVLPSWVPPTGLNGNRGKLQDVQDIGDAALASGSSGGVFLRIWHMRIEREEKSADYDVPIEDIIALASEAVTILVRSKKDPRQYVVLRPEHRWPLDCLSNGICFNAYNKAEWSGCGRAKVCAETWEGPLSYAMEGDNLSHPLKDFLYHACGNREGFHLCPRVAGSRNGRGKDAMFEVWLGFSFLPLRVMQVCARAYLSRPDNFRFADGLIKAGSLREGCRDARDKVCAAMTNCVEQLEGMQPEDTGSLMIFATLCASNKVLEKMVELDLAVHWKLMEANGDELQIEALSNLSSHVNDLSSARALLQDQLTSRRSGLETPDESVTGSVSVNGISPSCAGELTSVLQVKIDTVKNDVLDVGEIPLKAALRRFEKRVAEAVGAEFQASGKRTALGLFKKGFTLRQLLNFVDQKLHKQGVITPAMPTYQVVRDIIIPETKERQCCYADIFPGGPTEPTTLMSHWWGNQFIRLVLAICEHASGKQFLYADMYTEEELDKSYWLCIFGVNQHVSICGTKFNPCTCGGPKHMWSTMCQMDKFPLMMVNIPQHALAVDPGLKTLTRVWVLSELDEALHGGSEKLTAFCGDVDAEFEKSPAPPSVENAEASFPADKDLILGQIRTQPGGTVEFDERIGGAVKNAIALRRFFHQIESDAYAEFEEDLRLRPQLVEAIQVLNRAETPLLAVAREGRIDMMKLLLASKASVTSCSNLGWTALHYAALCPHQHNAAAAIKLLIDSNADVAAENDFGRLPLEEGVLAGASKSVIELLSSGGIHKPADSFIAWTNGSAFTQQLPEGQTFLPHPEDGKTFDHGVLRMTKLNVMQPIGKLLVIGCDWVKPRHFESMSMTDKEMLIGGSRRVAAYIRYRWPSWKFDSLAVLYCGSGFRVNFDSLEFTVVEETDVFDRQKAPMSFRLFHDGTLRYLYP